MTVAKLAVRVGAIEIDEKAGCTTEHPQLKTPEKDCQSGYENVSCYNFIPASIIWKLPSTPDKINFCKFTVKFCTKMHCNYNKNLYICVLCNRAFTDVFCH